MRKVPLPELAAVVALALAGWGPAPLRGQDRVETHWSVGATHSSAFGGTGAGASLGLVRGLYSGSTFLGGAGLELSWSRPRLSGLGGSEVPTRRDLLTAEAQLRSRVLALPGGIALEAAVPIGATLSRVGEAGATDPVVLPHNASGDRFGFSTGLLAGLRLPGGRMSILADTKLVWAWVYGQQNWLLSYRLGLELPFE